MSHNDPCDNYDGAFDPVGGGNGKERGILFSAPMVRALLDGAKTQTRRLVKPQPRRGLMGDGSFCPNHSDQISGEYHVWESGKRGTIPLTESCAYRWQELCPYGVPGDRLWVRETLRRDEREQWRYVADNAVVQLDRNDPRVPEMVAWAHHKEPYTCVSIHMPRWASRITLEITDVRVQRVQEISEEDGRAEGVQPLSSIGADQPILDTPRRGRTQGTHPHVLAFAVLWDTINGDRAPWVQNPWVWAITFKRV